MAWQGGEKENMMMICDHYKFICSAADAADNEDRPKEENSRATRALLWTNYQFLYRVTYHVIENLPLTSKVPFLPGLLELEPG